MKNFKRTTALILLIAIMTFFQIAFASENQIVNLANDEESIKPQAFYNSYTGTVKEITDSNEGIKTVYVENDNGGQAYFVISDSTYILDDIKIEVGKEITGYYEAGQMMIMIYPPRYSVQIITENAAGRNIKADKFDENLLSKDKSLKLNIGENTEIAWEKGTEIYWFAKPTLAQVSSALSNRKLIAVYDFTTKSIPPQTTPSKVVVLSKQENDVVDVSNCEIFVNGNKINASAYSDENGVAMVPLRIVAEELGFKVSWNEQLQSITVGNDITIAINKDMYIVTGTSPINLGAAPILKDEKTFVPIKFFNDVAGIKNVIVSDDKITIEN